MNIARGAEQLSGGLHHPEKEMNRDDMSMIPVLAICLSTWAENHALAAAVLAAWMMRLPPLWLHG